MTTNFIESAKELMAVLAAWAIVAAVCGCLSILLGVTGVWDWIESLYL